MLKTYLLFVLDNGTAELHFQGTICHAVVDQPEAWDSISAIAKRLVEDGEEITKIELLSQRWRQGDTKTYRVTTNATGEKKKPVLEGELVGSGV